MIRRQGYRFRLKPTPTDATLLRKFVGCSRFVWNELLAQNTVRYEYGEPRLRYQAMCGYLVYLKAEYAFLRDVHSQPLQQTLRDLDQAYQRALDPNLAARFPRFKRFKKKHRPQGIRFPQGFKIDGIVKNATVTFDGYDWYVTMQTEREVSEPIHASTTAVGIDLGVARFAPLSDGSFVDGANAFKKFEKRLAFYQRRVSRKHKFSANWRKANTRVSRLHRKIANIRNDLLHKASTTIGKNHAVVMLEDLRITNMTASAKGTIEQPGTNVRAESGLNRRILDQGWGEFRRQLAYK